jgi:NADPH2:quinone reductase
LPDNVSAEDAATVLFKGITAHYLLHSTYAVGPGTVVLLYGVAGALGQIMAPLCSPLPAGGELPVSARRHPTAPNDT